MPMGTLTLYPPLSVSMGTLPSDFHISHQWAPSGLQLSLIKERQRQGVGNMRICGQGVPVAWVWLLKGALW